MLSVQANRIRDLAQTIGLLEWRLGQMENQSAPVTPDTLFGGNGKAAAELPSKTLDMV